MQTPSGVENESIQGKIGNNTGQVVTYSASSPSDTCYSFATHNTTNDWLMTIQPSGDYTLECHFAK